MTPAKTDAQGSALYVARAFYMHGQPLAVGSPFAYHAKDDRTLVADLLTAGKLTREAPAAPALSPETLAAADDVMDAHAPAPAEAEAPATKPAKPAKA